MEQKTKIIKNLRYLCEQLEDFLIEAPSEEDCNDLENKMFADMENLLESAKEYLESF